MNKALHPHWELQWEPRLLALITSGILIEAESHLQVDYCTENQDTFVT